jgi:hypothetical protein
MLWAIVTKIKNIIKRWFGIKDKQIPKNSEYTPLDAKTQCSRTGGWRWYY